MRVFLLHSDWRAECIVSDRFVNDCCMFYVVWRVDAKIKGLKYFSAIIVNFYSLKNVYLWFNAIEMI